MGRSFNLHENKPENYYTSDSARVGSNEISALIASGVGSERDATKDDKIWINILPIVLDRVRQLNSDLEQIERNPRRKPKAWRGNT